MDLGDLAGKVVLVTGASRGIGAAVARGFAHHGAHVAVHYHAAQAAADKVVADARARGVRAEALQADLSDAAAPARLVAETIERFGRLDVLVNNAGDLVARLPMVDTPDDMLETIYALNIRSVVAASKAAVIAMKRQGSGNIINTSSLAARNGGGAGSMLYAGSKGFVSTFTRGLAKDVGRDGIRVNAVAPGIIETDLQDKHTSRAVLDQLAKATPLGRNAPATDCVGAYLFLASDRMSGFVTGQVIEVNGGILMP
ncbi:MAG: SDR family oxidoreductase [Alphaproteobacteria bacterium]|nr:SDR family oxidoreductase [Alphaproteobacteria bacterium]